MSANPKKYALDVTIQGLPKTINAMSGNFWGRRNNTEKWKEAVRDAVWDKIPLQPLKKARCTFTRYSSANGVDYDNLVHSFKCVLDGLIDSEIIEDDSQAHITSIYQFEKCKRGAGRIRIQVQAA